MVTLGLRQIGTLGDCLFLTPAIQALKERGERVIVQMHNDIQCREVSRIFDGLAHIQFVDWPEERLYIINKDKTHSAQRALNQLGIKDTNCIPKVKLTKDEISWAKDFLKKYQNPIIFINDNSGSWDVTNIRAQYVRPPVELMNILSSWFSKKNIDILQFGRKEDNKFTPLQCVSDYIRGLNIRQLLACYHVIGKMISGDTGDYHAMLAVGGKTIVLHPPDNDKLGYMAWDLHYFPELWLNEPIRCKYYDYTTFIGKELPEIMEFLK